MMKKLIIAGTIAGTILLSSFSASAAVVSAGGINWDDDTTGPGLGGVTAQANFQQWFTDSATGMAGGVDIITTDAAVAGDVGKELVGIGEFYSFADGREPVGPPSFCVVAGCELTFAFGGLIVNPDGITFSTAGAWFNIYIDQVPDFDGPGIGDTTLSSTAHTKFAEAQNGTLWASLAYDSFDLDGTLIGGETEFTMSVVAGKAIAAVEAALDYNSAIYSDIAFTAGATFVDGNLYTLDGNGQMINVEVPEPTSLAILGLGLLGLAGARRRKQA